jgi:hypothetical protein
MFILGDVGWAAVQILQRDYTAECVPNAEIRRETVRISYY